MPDTHAINAPIFPEKATAPRGAVDLSVLCFDQAKRH
jgi:hypothetical protein